MVKNLIPFTNIYANNKGMDNLLQKFHINSVEEIKSDTFNADLNIEVHDYTKDFAKLATKKHKLLSNQQTYSNLLQLIEQFEKSLDISDGFSFDIQQTDVSSLNIITPGEIEIILKDPINKTWIALSLRILNNEGNSLIAKILRNIIIERCKKILIQTVKKFKSEAVEIQKIHNKLLDVIQISDIFYEYQYENFVKFAELYKQCIHWYYTFYCLQYFNVLKDVKLESVGSIQEQASSYLAKWMNNATSEEFKYENHDVFMRRLNGFMGSVKDYVVPLQIIENNNALNWNVEDFVKNMTLTLKANYTKELDFVRKFIMKDDKLKVLFKADDVDYTEIYDNNFLFTNCNLLLKNVVSQIDNDYLGIFISIRLVQGYLRELEKMDLSNQLLVFFNDVLNLILWPKYQQIINSTILNHTNLKAIPIAKYIDFLKNLLCIDLAFGNGFDWSKDPQYQTFMNSLTIFESQNVHIKDKRQSWHILMLNLVDSISLKLLSNLESQEAYDEFMSRDNNILVTLRERYT